MNASAASSSAAERLERLLTSLGDFAGSSSSSSSSSSSREQRNASSASLPSTSAASPQPSSAGPLQNQQFNKNPRADATGSGGSASKYSDSVASALALADEIARNASSSHKTGSVAAALSSASSSSAAAAAAAALTSSGIRVRSDHIASREKSIDCSLVKCVELHRPSPALPHAMRSLLQRYKQTELSANETEGARVEKEIDVIMQASNGAALLEPKCRGATACTHAPAACLFG
jgi:hypothetical protein